MVTAASGGVLRFGHFEAKVQLGELRRQGLKIRLQDQPFQILVMLLERPGELVTREEIQKKLWPADTFVDFDHGLNNAMNRLREALGDSADTPRFIETLPKKGYRFIAPVNGTASAAAVASSSAALHTDGQASATTPATPVETAGQENLAPVRSRRWAVILAAGVLIIVAVFLWLRPVVLPTVLGSTQITRDGLLKTDLQTDGSRLYVTEVEAGHTILSQVASAGGETSQIAIPLTSFRLGGLSPNGAELLLAGSPTAFPSGDLGHEFPLWILPLPTGAPRRVGDVIANDANWSRDGTQILYTHGHDVYVSNREGTQSRKLATVPHYPVWPRWSPKEAIVRFTEYDLETNATWLWEVNYDGSHQHRLFPGWINAGQECCGNWTPDGKYYLFQSAGNAWTLRETSTWLRKSTSQPVQLTVGPLFLTSPVPSSDSHKLFVVGQQRRAEVVRFDAKSGDFVPYLAGLSGGQVDFSRDNQWVTYIAYPDETLWRSKLDGSERQQLTFPPLRAALPHWSPDGKQIAYMAANPGQRWKIFLMTVSDGSVRDPIPEQSNVGDPTWSSDGNSLAFGSLAVDANSLPGTIQLLDFRSGEISSVPRSQGMFSPRWSPDGRYLVTLSGDSEQLALFDFTTQKWSVLATQTIGYPSWSRDSKYVFFDDTALTADPAFYRVRVSDHALQRVASLKNIRQFATEWPFGAWTGLAPDDSLLLQRDISTQEVYALDLQLP
jgi:DNA-binding winged helix-turn-helix (wHTH) protein/Tol biopolymer transport system component